MCSSIKKFGWKDSRGKGSGSYSGYWLGYYLCDGTNHYEVNKPCGDFQWERRISSRRVGGCDKETCQVDVEGVVEGGDLPDAAQEVMGIFVPVPKGMLLVEQDWQGKRKGDGDFRMARGGEMVIPARLARGKLLANEEAAEVTKTSWRFKGPITVLIRNKDGEPVITT